MDQTQLIASLRTDLEEIQPGKNSHHIQSTIHAITRAINKLAMSDKSQALLWRKFAVDLMQAFTSEVQFHNLNKAQNKSNFDTLQLSEGFFKSFNILKDDLLKALPKSER